MMPSGMLTVTNNQRYKSLPIPFGGGSSTTGPNWSAPTWSVGPQPVASQGYANQYGQGFPSNNSVMLPYACKMSLDPQERKADQGMQELMFVRTSEPGLKTMPYPEYQFRNISRLNAHLRTPECRKKYGSSINCDVLMKDWQLFASQQRDPYDYGSGSIQKSGPMLEQVSTMIPGMRARMWNIWTASGCSVRPGNHAWLVVCRRKYKSAVTEALENSGMIFSNPPDVGPEEYYWQFEPYITTTSAPPPLCVYSNTAFQGRALRVGIVQEMYGDTNEQIDKYYLEALKAVFPTEPGDGYRKHLYRLNEVVIFIGVL